MDGGIAFQFPARGQAVEEDGGNQRHLTHDDGFAFDERGQGHSLIDRQVLVREACLQFIRQVEGKVADEGFDQRVRVGGARQDVGIGQEEIPRW